MTTTQELIARYLEARATGFETSLKAGDMDKTHGFASRASQLRLEAANIRNGEWKKQHG